MLDQYVDALVQQLRRISKEETADSSRDMTEESIDKGVRKIVDALTLGCPSCKVALDPNPDGCAAMRCGSCSKYFCFLCFDILKNNNECHAHVRQCPCNPSQNVFPPKTIRDNAQKQLRIIAVQNVLAASHGAYWRQHNHTKILLKGATAVLKDSFVTPEEVMGAVGSVPVAQYIAPTPFWWNFAAGFVVAIIVVKFSSSDRGVIADGIKSQTERGWMMADLLFILLRMALGFLFSAFFIQIPYLLRWPEHVKGFIIIFMTLLGGFCALPPFTADFVFSLVGSDVTGGTSWTISDFLFNLLRMAAVFLLGAGVTLIPPISRWAGYSKGLFIIGMVLLVSLLPPYSYINKPLGEVEEYRVEDTTWDWSMLGIFYTLSRLAVVFIVSSAIMINVPPFRTWSEPVKGWGIIILTVCGCYSSAVNPLVWLLQLVFQLLGYLFFLFFSVIGIVVCCSCLGIWWLVRQR